MRGAFLVVAALLVLFASYFVARTPVLTSEAELESHVGKVVTVRGMVTNTKIPCILSVEVSSGAPDLRGGFAEATGLLDRYVVTHTDNWTANRGTGVFYRLMDDEGKFAAQVEATSP